MTTLNDILTTYKDLLEKYSFNKDLFLTLQKEYKEGVLSFQSNILQEPYEMLSAQDIDCSLSTSEHCKDLTDRGLESIKKKELGILIVNGGMATRFGKEVKGLVDVYDKQSFLALKLQLIAAFCKKYNVEVPIFIMNSFNTEGTTLKFLQRNEYFGLEHRITLFNQSISLRLTQEGNIYLYKEGCPAFYAPGHGEFQKSMLLSGILQGFSQRGGKYLMFINVDNLAATLNPAIVGLHITSGYPLSFEVTKAFPGERGGIPLKVKGRKRLVEWLRLPADFNRKLMPYFNTNTMYFTVEALAKNVYNVPIAVVEKCIPQKVIQFETIAGELSVFLDSNFILVPREGLETRFIPVKSKEDLDNNREFIKKVVNERIK